MMTLQTKVEQPATQRHISYDDRLLFLGSCFAENISVKFSEYYFRVTCNPFGVLYNPASIARCLRLLGNENEEFPLSYIVSHDGMFHSLLHHSDFSSPDRKTCLDNVQKSIHDGQIALSQATVVVITLGTAWVYDYNGNTVANCHKMPSRLFVRHRLTVDQCADSLEECLRMAGKDKHFIITVSPVRHLKDGLHENRLSKAILMLAVNQVQKRMDGYSIDYFPAYELLEDELRDYRFYAADMIHPSEVAVEYIWQRFAETYFSNVTQSEMKSLHELS